MVILKTALAAAASIVLLFISAKLSGPKQISQMSLFDYITGITIGSIAAELATELENPEKPLTALIVYAAAAVVIGIITNRSTAARRFINGTPAILMKNGRMNRRAFKHAKLDIDEFLMISRVAGYFNIGDIRLALLEHNGKISFQPYSDLRPASPADLGIHPEKAVSFYEIIKDGRIDENTLKRSGFDRSWVERQLAAQHYALKDIMLGVCDKNGSLAIYPEEKGK